MQNPQVKSELFAFYPYQIPEVWDKIAPLIKQALDRGSRYTLTQVCEDLLDAKAQAWVSYNGGIEACLVTKIQDGYCLLLAAGGRNMQEWVKWLPEVEDWAKSEGCTEMRIYGRVGWAKVLGYDVEYTKMRKSL
jgi:hypothetical protein